MEKEGGEIGIEEFEVEGQERKIFLAIACKSKPKPKTF